MSRQSRPESLVSNAVIRVYDEAGNVIETHEHAAISKSSERCSLNKKPPRAEARRLIAKCCCLLGVPQL